MGRDGEGRGEKGREGKGREPVDLKSRFMAS